MSDVSRDALPPEEPILEKVARLEGEPSLFPPEVLRLHREGRALRARRELLRAAKTERDDRLAAKQRAHAADLRLWQEEVGGAPSMYTLNGIGTRLYGKAERAEDGTYIATLWFTVLFIPIWPIRAYVVFPAEGGGWHFLSKTPLPPAAWGVRRGVGTVAALLVLFAAYSMYRSGTHAVVHAYNGFDRAVHVAVGETEQVVRPRQAEVFEDVPAKSTRFRAAWDADDEPFESIDVDLTDRTDETVVYNVGGRAVIEYERVLYGEGMPAEPRILEAGPVLFEDDVDYPFTEPPDSITVLEDGNAERTVLHAVDGTVPPETVIGQLLAMGRADQARTVALAELEAHPEAGRIAYLLALTEHADDHDAQVALFRHYMERAPDAVDLHRFYQELWPEGSAELRAEYDRLLEANTESALYHYLAGRIADSGSDEALAHYSEATRLEPGYPPAVRALGYHWMWLGDWSRALEEYDRYAAVGPPERYEVFGTRARIAMHLGRPWSAIDSILAEALSAPDDAIRLGRIRGHRLVQSGQVGLSDAARTIDTRIEQVYGPVERETRLANLRADLAITTGDLALARRELDALEDPSDINAVVARRLALSDGATPADRERLFAIPGWTASVDPVDKVLALQLVDEDARPELLEQLDPSMMPIVELLDSDELVRTDRLRDLTRGLTPEIRVWVYFAAAWKLRDDRRAVRARDDYLDEAYGFALPGDLPYRR